MGDLITFVLMDPDGDIGLSPGSNVIRWRHSATLARRSMGVDSHIQSDAPPPRTYRADEDDTGFEIRAIANYRDRRGPLKSAESMKTAAVAANPIINAPPRFQTGGTQRIR